MKVALITAYALLLALASSFGPKKGWTKLLDKDLSQWEMYLSFAHQDGYKGEAPTDAEGNPLQPIGYNKNVNNVFSMIEEQGEPVLKVSGEIYGCVYTKQDFANYHLKLQVKWGNKKWVPRLNEALDSGILYHSVGEAGVDYWRSWMLSQEFQIMEDGFGDYWNIANANVQVKAIMPQGKENYVYSKEGKAVPMGKGTANSGFCQRGENVEKPNGQWNTVELITYGDRSIHIVNGKVVMALSHSSYFDGTTNQPLTKGKLQLQSEAAEVYFKDIQIRDIDAMPAKYAAYF